ncbi:MAG: hypothetical protein K2Q22_15095, partial [Cytophagales bacterium]|nr:hypothetical protein [Cytophagales bacterium]
VLSDNELNKAAELVSGIDENDMLFVALNQHLNSELWTGDRKLITGLEKRKYLRTLSTDDLYSRYIQYQLPKSDK